MTSEPIELTIVHLEDEERHRKQLARIFPRIKRALRNYLRRTFAYTDSNFPTRSYQPRITIRLKQYGSVAELAEGLVGANRRPTKVGESAAFFILDYFVPKGAGQPSPAVRTPPSLPQIRVDGQPFSHWLKSFFPHIPVTLLTVGTAAETIRPPQWSYINKDKILGNTEEFLKSLSQHFGEWWTPTFATALEEYGQESGASSWHTPGHNSGNAFARSPVQRGFYQSYGPHSFQTDLSVSVDSLGDLSEPDLDSPLKTARRRSAEIFGSRETFFVTNGTSTSNKAMLMTLLRPGDVVLLDRNCHKSVHQAVVMSGALPLYLQPPYNATLGIWLPLSFETLRKFLAADYPEELRPKMLILTTCTYEGMLYPIGQLAQMCEQYGVLFFADEAWAPYLRFHPFYTTDAGAHRYNAVDGGAHFVVQSTHKALAAFSQASMIHVTDAFVEALEVRSAHWGWLSQRFSSNGHGSYERFRHDFMEVLRYWHSTSPHYPMMASLDRAGIQMRLEGTRALEERIRWVEEFTEVVDRDGSCVAAREDIVADPLARGYEAFLKDPLKVVLAFRDEQSGREFKEKLKDARIQWEKSSTGCIEFLVTIGTYNDHLQKLTEVVLENRDLLGLDGRLCSRRKVPCGQVEVLPRVAAAAIGELIPIERSKGRIAAQMLVPYPPGIPIFLPGLRITKEMISVVTTARDVGNVHEVHGVFGAHGEFSVKVLTKEEEKQARRSRSLKVGGGALDRLAQGLGVSKWREL